MGDLLTADWDRYIAAAAVLVGLLVAFWLVFKATDWSIGTYRDAGEFDHSRIASLEADVQDLNARLDALTAEWRAQRRLKHDWRSFASSLLVERSAIRQFAVEHDCTEIIDLMDRLDGLRRDNPLMADLQSLTAEDGD